MGGPLMDERTYQSAMRRARALSAGSDAEYWMGYQRGLRRRYHGEAFGTPEEHALWMAMAEDADGVRAERGRGYRDGFEGRERWEDAERLRALLAAAGLSQRGAARELGISERAMRYYVAGEQPTPRAILLALEHLAHCQGSASR